MTTINNTSADAERAAFEAWSEKAAPGHSLDRAENGQYISYPVASAWHGWQARLAAGAPAETVKCGACNGTGWVPRDPDIGTEQECFSCGGSGESEADAAQAAPVHPTTAPAETVKALFHNVTAVTRASDQSVTLVFTSCHQASVFERAAAATIKGPE